MFSVPGLGACISCFSHWCDKIFHKSNFREEDFIWVTVRGCNLSWRGWGEGMAAGVGGGWSPGHITLAGRKQRGECCCSPGLHTWLAHLVCTPSFLTRLSPLFLCYQSGTQVHLHSGWLFLLQFILSRNVLTDTLFECVFYMTTNPDKVTKIKHHSVFWSFALPLSNDSLPYPPHLLFWCVVICSATPCGTGLHHHHVYK